MTIFTDGIQFITKMMHFYPKVKSLNFWKAKVAVQTFLTILKREIRLYMSVIKEEMALSRINRTTSFTQFDLLTLM